MHSSHLVYDLQRGLRHCRSDYGKLCLRHKWWRFADGLDATIRWYVDNEAWWRPIKSGEHHQAYYASNYADRSVFSR